MDTSSIALGLLTVPKNFNWKFFFTGIFFNWKIMLEKVYWKKKTPPQKTEKKLKKGLS